jgi:hypothetical protein
MYYILTQAVLVDIDQNTIECQNKHIAIPHRERNKLLSNLEVYAGSAFAPSSSTRLNEIDKILPGVPSTVQFAYVENSFSSKCSNSFFAQRKIRDIPKTMYRRYGNSFLQVKSGVIKESPKNTYDPSINAYSGDFSRRSTSRMSESSQINPSQTILDRQKTESPRESIADQNILGSFSAVNSKASPTASQEVSPRKKKIHSLGSIAESTNDASDQDDEPSVSFLRDASGGLNSEINVITTSPNEPEVAIQSSPSPTKTNTGTQGFKSVEMMNSSNVIDVNLASAFWQRRISEGLVVEYRNPKAATQ